MRGQGFVGFSGGRQQQTGIANLRDFFKRSVSVRPKTEGIAGSRKQEAVDCYNRGTLLYGQGDFKGAISQFTKAIDLEPAYAEAYNNLGIAHSALGELPEAIGNFKKALELNPTDAVAHINLGNAYNQGEDYACAILAFTHALDITPEFAEAHNGLGLAYEWRGAEGDADRAIECFDAAIRINREYADAYLNRGYAKQLALGGYFDGRGLSSPIADYSRAIELDPTNPLGYDRRANARNLLGMTEQANEDWRTANSLRAQ